MIEEKYSKKLKPIIKVMKNKRIKIKIKRNI